MATKQQLEQRIDDLLETISDLKLELSQVKENYGDTLSELREAQEEIAAAKGSIDIPWEETPIVYTRKPSTSSYKERMAAAKAKAMATGRAVLV